MKGMLTEANSYRIKEVVADLQIALEHPIFIEKRSGSENAEIVFRELKRLLEMIKDETTQLNEHLEMISSLKNQWYDSVRRASARNVEQAEKEYMEFVGSNYDAGSIADAKARLIFLTQRKRFLEAELDVCEVKLSEVKAVQRESQHSTKSNISLPKIQLEKFNGNRAEWFEFYENFNASVNVPTLTNTQRFTYLRTLLAGEAKTMIQGLALTDENYEVAIDLLKERYGNRAELLRQLYHDLSILPVCRTFGDCRDFLYKLGGLCRQLEALGETYDSPLLYHELELKLTKPILKEILIRKERYVQWNTAVFRMVLREVIQKEELLFRMMDTQNSRESKLRPPANFSGRSEKSKNLVPTLTFATTTSSSAPTFPHRPRNCFQNKAGMNFVKKGPHCAFCAASHWTAECDKFTTLESREKQKNFLKLCNKCLSKQHLAVDCKTVLKPCFYCKQTGHHQALCSQKFAVSQANVSAVASLTNKTNTALLMTVKAKMINPESNIQKEVIIFFDSGSHRSFVTNEVVETFKLNTMNSGSIKLYTFGSNVAKEHQIRLAQVKIESVNGSMIPLTVDIIDTIIQRDIPMALMNDMDVSSLLDSHFTATCENNKPDVLIGMDQMPKFEVSQIKLLNNGYALFDSRLGLISGKDDSVNDNCDSQMSVFVANVIEKQINEDSLFQLVNNHYELEKAGLEENEKEKDEFETKNDMNDVADDWNEEKKDDSYGNESKHDVDDKADEKNEDSDAEENDGSKIVNDEAIDKNESSMGKSASDKEDRVNRYNRRYELELDNAEEMREHRNKYKRSVADDKFFCLAGMHEFLDIQYKLKEKRCLGRFEGVEKMIDLIEKYEPENLKPRNCELFDEVTADDRAKTSFNIEIVRQSLGDVYTKELDAAQVDKENEKNKLDPVVEEISRDMKTFRKKRLRRKKKLKQKILAKKGLLSGSKSEDGLSEKLAMNNEPLVASSSKPLVASELMNNKHLVASSSKSFVSRQTRPSLDDRLQMFKRQRKVSSNEAGVSRARTVNLFF